MLAHLLLRLLNGQSNLNKVHFSDGADLWRETKWHIVFATVRRLIQNVPACHLCQIMQRTLKLTVPGCRIGVGSSEAKQQQGNFSWGQCWPGVFALLLCFSHSVSICLSFSCSIIGQCADFPPIFLFLSVMAPCLLSVLFTHAHLIKLRATVLVSCAN